MTSETSFDLKSCRIISPEPACQADCSHCPLFNSIWFADCLSDVVAPGNDNDSDECMREEPGNAQLSNNKDKFHA